MAYTKTLENCEDYFKPNNHIQSYSWRQYDEDVKNAAFNQAKRELQVALGGLLSDPSSEDDIYRQDYAHFEQSLFILENTPRQEADGVSNVIDEGDEDACNDNNPTRTGVVIAPQAKRYLKLNMIKMPRG